MAEQTTAAMWATDMAELTGCEQTIWVSARTQLPEAAPGGEPLAPEYPDQQRRQALELLLRGGMAGYDMYVVPLAPGIEAPWVQRGLLLTDDAGMARFFAALPGAAQADALGSGQDFLRLVHLSHASGKALAAFPAEHSLWALGADLGSLLRAIDLGLASYEGRWGDWLSIPMQVQGSLGILTPQGTPHWLQIGPDGRLWAADPWAQSPPRQGLEALVVQMPALCDGLCALDWPTLVFCALFALGSPATGLLGMEPWYYDGILKLVSQWAHTEDIVPKMPLLYVGDAACWPMPAETEPSPLGPKSPGCQVHPELLRELCEQAAPALSDPSRGRLPPHLQARLEQLRRL